MRRRDFIAALGGAAAWPLAARAQQVSTPVIGYLSAASPRAHAPYDTVFVQALRASGFVEGKNVAIEYRWAEGHYDNLAALARELVESKVAVLFAGGGAVTGRAATGATTTTPVVFVIGDDPVQAGLVSSLSRPGGNVTGVSFLGRGLGLKRLELLHDIAPKAGVVGVLVNPSNPTSISELREVDGAAPAMGVEVLRLEVRTVSDLEAAFARLASRRTGALLVTADAFYLDQRERLTELAAQHAIPAIYFEREFAAVGGLISYSTSLADAYRQAGGYVARILKGDKPADLPVLQGTKFELVVNLKAAKALGLTMPSAIIFAADEVIE